MANLDDVNDVLRAHARRVNDALWALDSARSLLRKAKAGYRSNPALGDAPWNVAEYERRVAAATFAALRLLRELGLAPEGREGPQFGTADPEGDDMELRGYGDWLAQQRGGQA